MNKKSALRLRRALTLASYTGETQELLTMAERAERDGYDDVWFADTGCPDALTLAAAIAVRSKRLRIGIAVTPIYTRSPAVLAASAATLSSLAPGRFILGLGSSSDNIVEKWHGLKRAQPLQRMRETVALLRSILAGQKSDFSGETLHSHGYRQKSAEVPLYIAALMPEMIEIAAEIGDGVVLNLFPRKALPKIMEHVAIGAARGGKSVEDLEILCRYQIAVDTQFQDRFNELRTVMSSYFSVAVYNRYLAWCGYPEQAEEISAAWKAGDRRRTAAALSDELLNEIAIVGSLEECRQRLRQYADGGIHTHIISCLSTDPKVKANTWEGLREDFLNG